MGVCKSCKSSKVATAKVVLEDGTLQEFSYPIKASYILSKDPNYFLCNSDEMDFNGIVYPVRDDKELQLGELYFVLPKTKLLRPLVVEEMVALAVKANAALLDSRSAEKCKCRRKVGFFRGDDGKDIERSSTMVADFKSAIMRRNENRNRNGNRNIEKRKGSREMLKMYVANLTVIPE